VKINKYTPFIFSFIAFQAFSFLLQYPFLTAIGCAIFFYWVSIFLITINNTIPLKALFLIMYSLQYLMGAALTYNGFEEYSVIYAMKISESTYYEIAIPFFLALQFGFNIFTKNNSLQINRKKINEWLLQNKNIPFYFVAIGFGVSLISSFVPSSLNFVVYLLESFKYIGVFIIISSYETPKPLTLVIVYGSIFISSFLGGMFHDLLTWIIILGIVLAYRYKPNLQIKIIAMAAFFILATFIQSIKGGLREATWSGGETTSIELISESSKNNNSDKGSFFSKENFGPQITRINQGWILASTVDNVPLNLDHTYGALVAKYLWSAIVPRLLDANKLNAGDQYTFNKYSGHQISGNTSMGLGLFADAYVEFGQYGGIFYVFLFGLMYGYIMKQFMVYSKDYPILILFVFLAFIYAIRPDCETQTALGHLFKTCLLLFLIFNFHKKTFKLRVQKSL
jgi:hypothetical protein